MAHLESLIFTALKNDTAVAALVGTRIHPLILPQKCQFPAITYQRISGGQEITLEGYGGIQRPRIQVDIWATGYSQAKQLAAAVVTAMNSGFNVSAISDRDLFEEVQNIYRVSIDFTVRHREV